jgi:flavin reductase
MTQAMEKGRRRATMEISDEFRRCLREAASSVTLLATQIGTRRFGMVATAVMSVSMEPPSLVVGINRTASIYAPLLERRAFVVNYLSEKSGVLAHEFSNANAADRFSIGNWNAWTVAYNGMGDESLPHLYDAQAAVCCAVKDVHVFGTHALVVGEVFDVTRHNEASPLMYCRGAYGSFQQTDRDVIRRQ